MPTPTLKITNGPSSRGFTLENGIVSEGKWDQVFTMDKETPDDFTIHKNKKIFQMRLLMLGRVAEEDVDHFIFIGYLSGRTGWFYVGTYNARTRTGQCQEMNSKEFFKPDIIRQLFPNLAPARVRRSTELV